MQFIHLRGVKRTLTGVVVKAPAIMNASWRCVKLSENIINDRVGFP